MKIRCKGEDIDNIVLFIITLINIVNIYFGFVSLILYFFVGIGTRNIRRIILPSVYLAINTSVGGAHLVGFITMLQATVFISVIVSIFTLKYSVDNVLNYVKRCPVTVVSLFLILLLSITRAGGIRIFLSLVLLVFFIIMCTRTDKQLYDVYNAIIISANQIVYIGIIEFVLQRTFFYSVWTGEERYRFGILRIGSTVSDPNYICMILLPILLLSYYMYKQFNERKYFLFFITYIIVSFLTISRTGWLCLVLALYFIIRKYYFNRIKKRVRLILNFLLFIACFIFLITLLSQFLGTENGLLQSSNFTRTACLRYGVRLFITFLWTGIGINQFYDYAQPLFYQEYGGHFAEGITVMNMPLEIALTFGLVGVILFILILIESFWKVSSIIKNGSKVPYLEMFLCFFAMAMTLDGMTVGLFWILIGLSGITLKAYEQNPGRSSQIIGKRRAA